MIPKFRAWHEQGFMLDAENIVKLNLEEEILEYCVLNEDGVRSDRECSFYEVKLMQSTGLFDKNGVEIFEGDILKIQTFDFYSKKINDEYIGQVCFSRGGFFVLTDGHHTDFCLCGKSTATMEVIGKLYENPELLEG